MIFTHLSARKVMVEDGLVHRFMTVIGHHRPGARRQSRGMVSPVKKPGSPPPHGSVVRVGTFDENIAHHAYRADHVACCDADDDLLAAVRHRYGPVDIDRRAIRYFFLQWHRILATDLRVDAGECVGVLREGTAVHVVGSSRWKTVALQRILRVSVSNGEHGRAQPVPAGHDRKIHFYGARRIRFNRLRDVRVGEPVNPHCHHPPPWLRRARPAGSVSWPP